MESAALAVPPEPVHSATSEDHSPPTLLPSGASARRFSGIRGIATPVVAALVIFALVVGLAGWRWGSVGAGVAYLRGDTAYATPSGPVVEEDASGAQSIRIV